MNVYFSFAWEYRGLVSNQQRCERPGPDYELARAKGGCKINMIFLSQCFV